MRWAGLSVEANPVAMGRGGSVIVVIDEGWVHSGESILFGDHIIVQNGIWDERAGDMMEGGIRKKKKKKEVGTKENINSMLTLRPRCMQT